jgi:hypothetical protein
LNRHELQDYLTSLATPPSQSPDSHIIESFFLDLICTHVFVKFANMSAASRVRNSLHGRTWPEERARQALWADFVPEEKVEDWIAEEQDAATGGRGRGKKWEIEYGYDDDRNVTATLQEAIAVPAQASRSSTGLGAPTGPRADRERGGDQGVSVRGRGARGAYEREHALAATADPADPNFIPVGGRHGPVASRGGAEGTYTKTTPAVLFIPVPKDIAEARLDNIFKCYAPDKDASWRIESEGHRYTFEREQLVNRGPEIFPGIRKPPGVRRRALPREILFGDRGGPRDDRRYGGRGPPRGDRYAPPRRGGYGGGRGGSDMYSGGGFRSDSHWRGGGGGGFGGGRY